MEPRLKNRDKLKNKDRLGIIKFLIENAIPGLSYVDVLKRAEREYYNPKREKGITSGDKKLDFLYNNQWLFDVPGINKIIKNKAKQFAEMSQGVYHIDVSKDNRLSDIKDIHETYSIEDYRGTAENWQINKPLEEGETMEDFDKSRSSSASTVNLVDQYFSKDAILPKSTYTPTSDYLEFLPSYSIKQDFNKDLRNQNFRMNHMIDKFLGDKYENFIKNKIPIYASDEKLIGSDEFKDGANYDFDLKVLGINLAHHKLGAAWDKDVDLPYISIADAWDFSPDDYTKIWTSGLTENEKTQKKQERLQIQSTLLHKAGNPFKIYDRFYFDPETRKYISDEDISNINKTNKQINRPTPTSK